MARKITKNRKNSGKVKTTQKSRTQKKNSKPKPKQSNIQPKNAKTTPVAKKVNQLQIVKTKNVVKSRKSTQTKKTIISAKTTVNSIKTSVTSKSKKTVQFEKFNSSGSNNESKNCKKKTISKEPSCSPSLFEGQLVNMYRGLNYGQISNSDSSSGSNLLNNTVVELSSSSENGAINVGMSSDSHLVVAISDEIANSNDPRSPDLFKTEESLSSDSHRVVVASNQIAIKNALRSPDLFKSEAGLSSDSYRVAVVSNPIALNNAPRSPDLFDSDSAVEMELQGIDEPKCEYHNQEETMQDVQNQIAKCSTEMVSIGIQCSMETKDVAVGTNENFVRDSGVQTSPISNSYGIIDESSDDLDDFGSFEESIYSYSGEEYSDSDEHSSDDEYLTDYLDDFDLLEDLQKNDENRPNEHEIQQNHFNSDDNKSVSASPPMPHHSVFTHNKFHAPESIHIQDDQVFITTNPEKQIH